MTTGKTLNLWVFGDAHVGTDLRRARRESLAETIRQVEGPDGFDWDVAVDIGDMSGGQAVPEADEGAEVVRQFGALTKHRREDIYSVCGNHDRSGLDEEPNWWWRKWIDPTAEHTEFSGVDAARRRYPVDGTWERYAFRVGNVLFLMMSDINEPSQTVGRGDLGGNPAGVVSGETLEWWKGMVEANPDSIIISAHHYMLKDTSVASGEWEGMRKDADGNWTSGFHGYFPQGAPKGASYLYFVGSVPDAQAFEGYLAARPGAVDIWLGGHTHTHPDDTTGGKSHVETRWGTHFVNCGELSKCHGRWNTPKSRLFTFTDGSDEVRVRCCLHTDDYAPRGWYDKIERTLRLSGPFAQHESSSEERE